MIERVTSVCRRGPTILARGSGTALGHQAIELLEALLRADQAHATLYMFASSADVAMEELYRLWTPRVSRKIWRRGMVYRLTMRLWRWMQPVRGPYYPRQLLRRQIPICLTPCARWPQPIVVMHAREAGWKQGREVHDTKPQIGRSDVCRNASIETYRPAVVWLCARGYHVVRMGDPSMSPWEPTLVEDLTRHPQAQLSALLQARFCVAGESGPAMLCYLTNTPCLTVNVTDPISSYPIRADGFYLLKGVTTQATERPLSLIDLLSESYLRDLRRPHVYRYQENSPEQILSAVQAMDAHVSLLHEYLGRWDELPMSPAQGRWLGLATEHAEALKGRGLPFIDKWGSDAGFLGDGRLVPDQAAQVTEPAA